MRKSWNIFWQLSRNPTGTKTESWTERSCCKLWTIAVRKWTHRCCLSTSIHSSLINWHFLGFTRCSWRTSHTGKSWNSLIQMQVEKSNAISWWWIFSFFLFFFSDFWELNCLQKIISLCLIFSIVNFINRAEMDE
jgi:hypothetical protein